MLLRSTMNVERLRFLAIAAAASLSACAPDVSAVFRTSSNGDAGGGGAGGDGGAGGAATTSPQGGGTTTGTTTGGTTTAMCDVDPNADLDDDGFTPAQGDCSDCNAGIHPGAYDVPGNGIDEDCNGKVDDAETGCDVTVSIDNPFPEEVARAVDLCKVAKGASDWGIVSAAWVLPDGSPKPAGNAGVNFDLGHGVVPSYGPNVLPRGGSRVLLLSNGTARRPGDPGYQSPQGFSKGYNHGPPPGFPKESVSCPGSVSGPPHDGTALSVTVRAPTNAYGFSYDFSFYAYDFPAFVCQSYNDVFFAILSPAVPGQPDGNIAVDELGNPVTLNGAHFRVCGCANGPPCMAGGKTFLCPLGTAQLQGTGFDENGSKGATGWLTTTVPVTPGGEITIRWGVYDAGDGVFDSTVVLDNWRWITTPGVEYGTAIAE